MPQLLVRDLDSSLVNRLKRRAADHGVSAEEEHRRILKEVLLRPPQQKPSLIEFLISDEGEVMPEVELALERSREIEVRDTGLEG
jgi:plasmid stability protein